MSMGWGEEYGKMGNNTGRPPWDSDEKDGYHVNLWSSYLSLFRTKNPQNKLYRPHPPYFPKQKIPVNLLPITEPTSPTQLLLFLKSVKSSTNISYPTAAVPGLNLPNPPEFRLPHLLPHHHLRSLQDPERAY